MFRFCCYSIVSIKSVLDPYRHNETSFYLFFKIKQKYILFKNCQQSLNIINILNSHTICKNLYYAKISNQYERQN